MSSEVIKDPAIKLFGKTIQLLPGETTAPTPLHHNKKPSGGQVTETKPDQTSSQPIILEDLICPGATSSAVSEDPKTPGTEKENPSPSSNKNDNSDPNEPSTTSEEKTLKKPDKILPCPRCNSMDTKFCYYNNYNVNQPRHFCKNCQRYWTAGGSMRNVPVGSGRRKNKTSPASHYRQIIVPESLQPVSGTHLQTNNGSILAFGSDEPLCESMASVLNLADKSMTNTGSSSNQTENGKTNSGGLQGPPPPIPCFPAPPWPSTPWTNQMPPPVFGPSTYPVSFYPVPHYWGYTVPNPWNMPLLSPQPCSSSDHSPTLGKHHREGVNEEDKSSEGGVLVPKTLRINDPNEAAKSSIWSTLGINNENSESTGGSGLFGAFRTKGSNEKNHMVEASPVLQANPAALSRSLNFHETS